jgi:hypothetical protein
MAEEQFEFGHMTWRSDTREIIVAIGHDMYAVYKDTYTDGEREPRRDAPPGLFTPVRGFGKLWRTTPDLVTSVGFARGDERSFWGAIQDFDNGTMIWMGIEQRMIRILYSDGSWSLVHDNFVD